jgi:hypothetical protein
MTSDNALRIVAIGTVTVALRLPSLIEDRVRSQLEPFIALRDEPVSTRPGLELDLRLDAGAAPWRDVHEGDRVAVDTSLYRHLASNGLRFPVDGGYVVRIELTQSHVFFDAATRCAVVHQPDPDRLVLDGVRTLKSLLTTSVEIRGGVQLHSAAVTLEDGRAILLLGDMWQGKTTLLLELMAGFRVEQLSCDTVVLLPDADGRLSAHGWPSPFSVSHGTLSDHPELAGFFPEDRRDVPYDTLWREGKKTVLTSQQVVQQFATGIAPSADALAHCVIVRFRPDQPTGLTSISSTAELAAHLRTVYLGSRDPIYHNWHRYVVAGDELIERNIEAMSARLLRACPVTVLTWAPSATSLLKRIPDLGRVHKHLGQLLTSF